MKQYVNITISPEQKMFGIQGLERLTAREREILQDVVNNKTCKEIARLRGITPRTAEVHKSNIMIKMGVHRTIEIFQVLYVLATEKPAAPPSGESNSKVVLSSRSANVH
jgi:DNA-binding CsgD family transcriptional regulator